MAEPASSGRFSFSGILPSNLFKSSDQKEETTQPEEPAPESCARFFVVLAGKTNRAHESVVEFIKSLGQKETTSPGDAHYCLVFCPVVSRVGTDVRDALDRLPDDKEAVLVVMHPTFNPERVVPPSSSLVDDQRVRLTLDCLFYLEELLDCGFNDHMKTKIEDFFRKVTYVPQGDKSSEGAAEEFTVLQCDQKQDTSPGLNEALNQLKKGFSPEQQQVLENLVQNLVHVQLLQKILGQEIKTLQVQNEEKDKKIKALEEDVAELKQHAGLHDPPGSSGGSVPAVSAGGPEPGGPEPEGPEPEGPEPGGSEPRGPEPGGPKPGGPEPEGPEPESMDH